jgi:hypothetical protein
VDPEMGKDSKLFAGDPDPKLDIMDPGSAEIGLLNLIQKSSTTKKYR